MKSKVASRLVLLVWLAVGIAVEASAYPITIVLSGADYSGSINNSGGTITVLVTDIVSGVSITVMNNLIDPDGAARPCTGLDCTPSAVTPERGSLVLLGTGLAALTLGSRKRED